MTHEQWREQVLFKMRLQVRCKWTPDWMIVYREVMFMDIRLGERGEDILGLSPFPVGEFDKAVSARREKKG